MLLDRELAIPLLILHSIFRNHVLFFNIIAVEIHDQVYNMLRTQCSESWMVSMVSSRRCRGVFRQRRKHKETEMEVEKNKNPYLWKGRWYGCAKDWNRRTLGKGGIIVNFMCQFGSILLGGNVALLSLFGIKCGSRRCVCIPSWKWVDCDSLARQWYPVVWSILDWLWMYFPAVVNIDDQLTLSKTDYPS